MLCAKMNVSDGFYYRRVFEDSRSDFHLGMKNTLFGCMHIRRWSTACVLLSVCFSSTFHGWGVMLSVLLGADMVLIWLCIMWIILT